MKIVTNMAYTLACGAFAVAPALADDFASQFDVNDFYLPFALSDITPENQQTWPYYKHVSAHWDDYALHGTASISAASDPAVLKIAEGADRLDLRTDWRDERSFLDSLQDTQVKAFLVIKDNVILAEFYDNGFNLDSTQLLQSASKSYAGVIAAHLVDEGLLDRDKLVSEYLDDFAETDLGRATVQQVMDMTSGLASVTDFTTPGGEGFVFETEQGLRGGEPIGHRKAVQEAKAETDPGAVWAYNDKCTDVLAMLAEAVTEKPFVEHLSSLFDAFGANSAGSIALTSDGTTSPSYGISTTLRDYALFHQWIAQGKAPGSYYASLRDANKDLFSKSDKAKYFDESIYYGDQSYYMPGHDVIYSSGSFGQLGYSDLRTGVSVVFMQDWATNIELDKLNETNARALAIINYLRAQAAGGVIRGQRL